MKKNTKKILAIIFSILIIVFLPIIFEKNKANKTIKLIRLNYSSQKNYEDIIDKKYIEKIYNKVNRNADEEFIIGYLSNQEVYFKIAYNKIHNSTNKFVKYYIYNIKARENIQKNNIKKAKEYTEAALKNINIKLYDKSYYLIWKSLKPYINANNGRIYILNKLNEYIEKNKNDIKYIYRLKQYASPIMYLLGEREEAINNLLQIMFIADKLNDANIKTKSIIDIATIFIDLQIYDWADLTLKQGLKNSKNIKDEDERIALQLYAYIERCSIYYNTERYEELKQVIDKIYEQDKKIKKEEYKDFLIMAKTYESMYMIKENRLEEAGKILNEAKKNLNKDDEILIVDKYNNVLLAEIELKKAKGNYKEAIKLCEDIIEGFKNNRSFRYEVIFMNILSNLYKITQNTNQEKLDKYIYYYTQIIENEILESYWGNNLNKYENVKNLNKRYKQTIVYITIISVLGLSTTLVTLMYKRKKQKNELLKKDMEILNNQYKYQLSHYDNIKENQDEIRLIWHDMKNHINTVTGLINDNNYDEVKKYLYNLDNYVGELRSKVMTKNKVLDAILYSKNKVCETNNIDFNIDLKLPEVLVIDDIDICIIFGNLIDNAIEACCNIKDVTIKKYIKINGGIKNNYIYIKIENSKENEINQKGNRFITNKEDKENHGLGIQSVKNSIGKYNGNIKIEHCDKIFKVLIMINKGS